MDLRILEGIERIDRKTFELIFKGFYPALLAFARKFTGSAEDSSDIVQKVFIHLWENRESMEVSPRLKSYLFTAVHNRCLNHLRDQKKFVQKELPENEPALQSYLTAQERMEEDELRDRIRAAIDRLPEKTREVFKLSRFEHLKYAEIAQKLGISPKTVENQMLRALKMLREDLKDYLLLIFFILIYYLQ